LACCAIGTAFDVYQESFQNAKKCACFAKQNDLLKQEKDQFESSLMHEISKAIDVTETTPLIRPNKKQNGESFFN
jgi:hypothetical protein